MSKIIMLGGSVPQMPVAAHGSTIAAPVSGANDLVGADASSQAPSDASSAGALPVPVEPVASADQLTALVAQIQSKVAAFTPGLEFSVDQLSGKSIVTITDTATNDVVWQFPSVAAIQISKELDQFQKGVLINRKA
jgi:flagellar protein FlaG